MTSNKLKDYVHRYLNEDKGIQKIEFPELLEDLERFTRKQCMQDKVARVIALCIKQGHNKLVERIEKKYRHYLPRYDFVMALKLSLQAEIRQKTLKDILPKIPKTP